MDNSKPTILGAAVSLARRKGLRNVTRLDVANEAETATGTVNYHFETMDKLRAAVVEYAIKHEVHCILAEAIVCKHPGVKKISGALRQRALNG